MPQTDGDSNARKPSAFVERRKISNAHLGLIASLIVAGACAAAAAHFYGRLDVSERLIAQGRLASATPPSFADVIESVSDGTAQVLVAGSGDRGGNPLSELFQRFGIEPDAAAQEESESGGVGSGFFIDEDGHFITAAHVVGSADAVTVRLRDGGEAEAKVLGSDPRSDIALLKVDAIAKGKPLALANPRALRVGDWVLAIGSPFGFEASATLGILSAKGRAIPDGSYLPFLQSDVAINPGNSGGPLFDASGKVVGVNTQIYSNSGGYMGLSFSVPIDHAMKVVEQIKRHGKARHGRLGIVAQEMTPELAVALGSPTKKGALVVSVDAGGPAQKGGLAGGDVVVAFDGEPVSSFADLTRMGAESLPGAKAEIGYYRAGRKQASTIVVGEPRETQKPPKPARAADENAAKAFQSPGGVLVRDMAEEERNTFGEESGVVVVAVAPGAARGGLRSGDLIQTVDFKPISAAEQWASMLRSGKPSALLVRRGAEIGYFTVRK